MSETRNKWVAGPGSHRRRGVFKHYVLGSLLMIGSFGALAVALAIIT